MTTRLRQIIKEKGFTIAQTAEMINMTRENLTRYVDNPSISILEKCSNAMQIPIWQFFTTKEEILKDVESASGFTCPKCGAKLEITIKEKQS